MDERMLRDHLRKALSWHDAHLEWEKALTGLPAKHRGAVPLGTPHSPWEITEHVRTAQWDILEFCRDPKHAWPDWPAGDWLQSASPPNAAAWDKSVKAFQSDMEAMGKLVADPKSDLFSPIPHGSGQTILREALRVVDHNSYHLGQFVLVRRLLGAWPES
jgi:hypothetical protein